LTRGLNFWHLFRKGQCKNRAVIVRIAILSVPDDKSTAEHVADVLRAQGHEVALVRQSSPKGASWVGRFLESVRGLDVLIAILSKSSLYTSGFISREFTLASIQAKVVKGVSFVTVLVDDSQVPSYLADNVVIDVSRDIEGGVRQLASIIASTPPEKKNIKEGKPASRRSDAPDRQRQVAELGVALHAGRLTLVCGAGVSVEAGVPAWGDLLHRLLTRTLKKLEVSDSDNIPIEEIRSLQDRYSSLVIGRYLKNNLGEDFLSEVRDALYATNPTAGEIIKSIVALARPERDGEPLDSILTFNFDGLVEEELRANDVSHRSIHTEGARTSPSELPVYHVHGYLPRSGKIEASDAIVFSEDAYHSQFIEPFSWPNLIQLGKFADRTCLLIGISLSDPNLRRLLDVAHRKATDGARNHFIIKKLASPSGGSVSSDLVRLLEEQDANALGLNVIWVSEFSDIPIVLREIRAARGQGPDRW